MTNEERALKLIEARRHLPAAGIVEGLAAAGLLAPDPPPRYTIRGRNIWRRIRSCSCANESVAIIMESTTDNERDAMLSALNAMQEEA